jgi:hypothetical protein
MRLTSPILLTLAILGLEGNALRAEDYLTKEGKLDQALKLIQLQGGFAGNTGVQITIAPDGTWASESVFNAKLTPKDKGKLSEKDLAKLGAVLKKYDLSQLPAKAGKEPGANPHSVTLEFGGKKATLVGQTPPKLDSQSPTGTVESRFAGIWMEVTGLLAPEVSPKERQR